MRRNAIRRMIRKCMPARLGQVPAGFFLAAGMIFLFQFAQPAKAATVTGGSENDYFRIDWKYDLTAGTGTLTFTCDDLYNDSYHHIYLNHFRFCTLGTAFTSITNRSPYETQFASPVLADQIDGKNLYQYDLLDDGNPYLYNQISISNNWPEAGMYDLTFAPNSVETYPTQVNYTGIFSGINWIILPESFMDFVSIQSIPEPASLVTLGVGAAMAAASLKRKDEE